jgi:hypothetical protein
MNIKELADSYLKNRKDYEEYYENDYCQNNYSDMREAFIAGFLAGKEQNEKDNCPTSDSVHPIRHF